MPEGTKFWSKVVLSTFRLEGTKCLFPATLPGSKLRQLLIWLVLLDLDYALRLGI